MSCLNKVVFDAAYAWHLEHSVKIYILVTGAVTKLNMHPDLMSRCSKVKASNGEVADVIILNISPKASKCESTETGFSFSGRFNGVTRDAFFSWDQINNIYNPLDESTMVTLPMGVITSESAAPVVETQPAKKPNPFSVVTGGKQ